MHKVIERKQGNKKKYEYNDLLFDSKGEVYFYWWVVELHKKGVITSYEIYPEPFELSQPEPHRYIEALKTKNRNKKETIIQGHIYTPDFVLHWNPLKAHKFVQYIDDSVKYNKSKLLTSTLYNQLTYIEVKPSYDQNNMTRAFKINQKWVYFKYREYVNLVIAEAGKKGMKNTNMFFNKTFVPKRFLLTDAGTRKRIIHYPVKTLTEYLK